MVKFPCRCNKCRGRKTLSKHPDDYQRDRYKTCSCGGHFVVDTHRRTREHKRAKCGCDALPFPHRKASSVFCIAHPVGPSDADYEQRYGDHYKYAANEC